LIEWGGELRRRGGSVGIRGGLGLVLVVAAVCVAQLVGSRQSAEGRIRSDVMFLASDKLEGRRTGTEGANEAAAYIANEFKRLGLKPGGAGASTSWKREVEDGCVYAAVPICFVLELGKGCEMLIGPGIPAEEIARLAVVTMDASSRRQRSRRCVRSQGTSRRRRLAAARVFKMD
jgi:hypothetical protein